MAYNIALRCGEWNVEGEGGLLSRMTYNQLWSWVEFNKIYPFTLDQEDYRVARIVAAIYNTNMVDADKAVSASDFVLPIDERIRLIEEELDRIHNPIPPEGEAKIHWGMYVNYLEAIGKPSGEAVHTYKLIGGPTN